MKEMSVQFRLAVDYTSFVMRFLLFLASAALFMTTVESLPRIFYDTGSSDPDSIDPNSSSQSTGSSDVPDDVDSYSPDPIDPNLSSDNPNDVENLQDPSLLKSQKPAAIDPKYDIPLCCNTEHPDEPVCTTCESLHGSYKVMSLINEIRYKNCPRRM